MNEKLNLVEVLKNCPSGIKLYSTIYGEVTFLYIDDDLSYPIVFERNDENTETVTSDGMFLKGYDGECTLFPSINQRDWSKFTAPWYKKEKFDPKTLRPFDKVLVRDTNTDNWRCEFFSHAIDGNRIFSYVSIRSAYKCCIPYNDETKHLVGKVKEAPEFYRYWED